MVRRTKLGLSTLLALALGIAGCGNGGGDREDGGTGGTPGDSGTDAASDASADASSNTPPQATIIAPATDSGTNNNAYAYDGRDDDLGLWYKDVIFEGMGTDVEDGALTGASLEWKTDRSSVQTELLGTGANLTVRLYSNVCEGTTHVIRLEATDSDGNTTASDPRTLTIWTLC